LSHPIEEAALMKPPQAGEYLGGVSTSTLAKWRISGLGPEYVKLSSRVFYRRAALDRFIEARRRLSTSVQEGG
jgi:hypothetical protein